MGCLLHLCVFFLYVVLSLVISAGTMAVSASNGTVNCACLLVRLMYCIACRGTVYSSVTCHRRLNGCIDLLAVWDSSAPFLCSGVR